VHELRYDLERDAVRVVLADAGGRVLLFNVMTPDEAPGGWWELPGGGIGPGESYLEVPEITRSRERFYPGRLPELLPRFLAGEDIDEPFERWN
jgi:hypothetical protein